MITKLLYNIQEQGGASVERIAPQEKKLDTPKEASKKIVSTLQRHTEITNEKLAKQFPTYAGELPKIASVYTIEQNIENKMKQPVENLFNELMLRMTSEEKHIA